MMTTDSKKQTLRIVGVIAALLGFASKLVYRPWVIENQMDDFGLQGFAPSFFYVLGACLLIAGFSNKNIPKNMALAALGAAVYELEQNYTSRVFDYLDLIATGVGLGLALLISEVILKDKAAEETFTHNEHEH
ncbi:hypothetical protein [Pontibacter burrus]|uniref:VanZ-like domain-containing protein n=1 Tax=Pontibacter burrus TaxID=2704466 RepID=A0A6B3M001_9BACT|nr:hypothetical protein [Pontibacter burrus]NEM98997.1 hypothetical protein [Pontibacter burrus]